MRHFFRPVSALLALSLLCVPAALAERVAVRLPADAAGQLEALSLAPVRAQDYGSFRWLELDAADAARLAAAGVEHRLETGALEIRVGGYAFDPLVAGEPDLAPGLEAASSGPGFRLVQFGAPVRDAWLGALEAAGVEPLQYYPHHTYLVWADDAAAARAAGLAAVRWLGAFHPAYKAHADLAGRSGRIANVDVHFYSGLGVETTLRQLESLGARVLGHHAAQPDGRFWDAIVELPASAVADVARLPQVLWLGYESPRPVLDDEMSDQILAGNYAAGAPFVGYFPWLGTVGLDGTGVVWAIVDTGVDYDHPDLGAHIAGGYDFPGACTIGGQPGTDCPGGGHGTHVAGIVGGDATGGFTDPGGFLYGLGMAPSYSIFAMNSLSAAAWPPAGGWQEHSKRAVLGGALGGNNSWTTGEGTAHGYQASERTHDLMVRDGNFDTAAVAEPLIEVFSAGNSGPGASTLTSPKEAKNLIIVAASRNFRVGSIDTLASFSSRGPAVDGRHGITIATPGEQIASSRNDTGGSCSTAIGGTNNLYAYCSGTSMAAPHASGSIVLAAEWWRGFNAGADPSPAMAKALLVNSAVDMGTADIPNTSEGWGRVHLDTLFDPTIERAFVDQTELFEATGEFLEYTWGVPDTGSPLKITMAWSDAPGAVGANPALVNNLDLTVTTGGNTYLGNVFSGGWSTTGGSADQLNNIENVYVQSPGGSVTIRIDASNVAGDGVPYNGDPTDQDFALVCSNCAMAADFSLDATPNTLAVCAPANAVYTVDIGSILGFTAPVSLLASGNPAGTSVGFSTNPVTPPGSSTMTVSGTGGAAAGSYSILVEGSATGSAGHSDSVGLDIFSGTPGAPVLTAPVNSTSGHPVRPTFQWNAAAGASEYLLEVDDDADFSSLVYSA
ncbi:MAG TPA: S8 family serine peptidase, partial [Thermoanaerobaculia bacterium]|nr:S8 family serine peptidase [Thermoanaerobaculia bacterium]